MGRFGSRYIRFDSDFETLHQQEAMMQPLEPRVPAAPVPCRVVAARVVVVVDQHHSGFFFKCYVSGRA